MSEVKRYWIHWNDQLYAEDKNGDLVMAADFDRVTAERDALRNEIGQVNGEYDRAVNKVDALQALLTAADEENDALKGLAVKQAALLDELGIPLDEVDDLFGETLKNAKRYEYVRSVMAVENFPAPHPAWSEPSEVESKRIDDLCDAALKPAEPAKDEHVCTGCGSKGWTANCAECVPY